MSEPEHGEDVPFTTFELEPLDSGEKRSWRAEEIWRTARHKTNRIALGRPSWRTATGSAAAELSFVPQELREDLRSAMKDAERLWALGLDLTLLPDEGCRFVSAQLSLHFTGGDALDDDLPLVRRLRPDELHEQQLDVQERSLGLQVSASGPVVTVVGGEANIGRARRTETSRTLVHLSGFGAGTAEAGWRFRLTNAREIPLNATGLEAFVVADHRFRGEIAYSVVARIEIRSTVDRWLTAVFVPKESGTLRHTQAFPPPL
ncbi:hypothetical protein [Streptomyces sp. NBC_00038]|uniref:hypothetical protein n=1 Tax=Streptomyces sp. NBC_00038 TaxID=2903615 RepID=UPI002259D1A7|nr:hypothetical protein [Streptomyces sp. NBC_00038]MCX5561720.1 hypothetical protein [Streptomyces sp. NBC_00038]